MTEHLAHQIGPYLLEAPLGRGGMGLVYRARHVERGTHAALKTVRLPKRNMLASIRREIRALARLQHPGIVRIAEHGVDSGLPWYAMELLEAQPMSVSLGGPTVAPDGAAWWTRTLSGDEPTGVPSWQAGDTLDANDVHAASTPSPPTRTPSSPDQARGLEQLHQLCQALAYLHGEGLVHRDVKPDNVLVRGDGRVVLVDFGLASSALAPGRERIDVSGQMAGTVYYMAPELIEGQRVDARADLYAVGCLLFQLLTGQPPFCQDKLPRILMRHLYEPAPSLEGRGLPPDLVELTAGLLEKLPSRRPGYAEDVVAILDAHLERDTFSAPPARPYLYRPVFVSRDAELAAMRAGLDTLHTQRRVVVAVTGAQGQGKTRLLNELLHESISRSAVLLLGRCHDPKRPLHPFAEILEQRIDALREHGEDHLNGFIEGPGAALVNHFDSLAELSSGSGEASASERLDALDLVILQHTEHQPALLVLDDLHLADADTLRWLERTLKRPQTAQALLVVTAFRPHPRLDLVLGQHPPLQLTPLERDAIEAMVRSMLATSTATTSLLDLLVARSEGNPFFVVEFLRMALSRRELVRQPDGTWRYTPQSDASLPSLQTLITRRIEHLSEPAGRLASTIVLHGGAMHPGHVCPCVFDRSLDGLDELVGDGILEFNDEGALTFTQRSYEEAVRAALSPELQTMLEHALHTHFEERDPELAFLTQRLIHTDRTFLEDAILLHHELDNPTSAALMRTRLALHQHDAGELDAARVSFDKASRHLEGLDHRQPGMLAFHLLAQSKHQRRLGDTESSQALLERAHLLLGDQPVKAGEALLLCERIHHRFARGLNAPRLVKRMRALRRELELDDDSLLGDTIDAVEAALAALEAGAPMLAGEALSRLSRALRTALKQRAGQARMRR